MQEFGVGLAAIGSGRGVASKISRIETRGFGFQCGDNFSCTNFTQVLVEEGFFLVLGTRSGSGQTDLVDQSLI